MVYDERLRRMENLFEIMECPERFKVHLAAYQLEKEAEFWWGIVKHRVGEYLAKPQRRERASQNQRGKKTLLSLTLV